MNKMLIAALAAAATLTAKADVLPVKPLKLAGPFTSAATIQVDTVDANGKKYNDEDFLRNGIMPQAWRNGQEAVVITDKDGNPAIVLKPSTAASVYLTGFTFDNTHFAKCAIKVKGASQSTIYIDNKEGAEQNLTPGRHEVAVKIACKANAEKSDTLTFSVESEQAAFISLNAGGKRPYTLADYMNGEKASTTALSANGRYLMLNSYAVGIDTRQNWKREIIDLKTGTAFVVSDFKEWASADDRYISLRKGIYGENIYEYVDPATQKREPLFTDYGKNSGNFLNGEKEMLINKTTEGPKEDAQVHQVLEPDDRQPGWRNRNSVQLLNVANGQLTQLTAGHHSTYATFSDDGKKVLISSHYDELTEWPFSFRDVFLYNRETQQLDTLVKHSGHLGSGTFMPDGNSIVFTGNPEAFDGLGKTTDKIASLVQTELFIMDLATKQVKSLTRNFNPNIKSFEVSKVDGCIYALCENRDRQDIFRINPKTGKINQLNLSECFVKSFALADNKALLSYTGQSDSNADRVYTVDLKNNKETLIRDYNATRMGDIALGKCEDWYFVNSRGDSICGRYYLPANFDPAKKYPMLVYYYGGCSPTGRYLESYYNFHGWAAMGYVVYVVQPSGCTGFGQEFAARHVNTYGEGTAEDIIEGTQQFCREHPYVNKDKIGCLGASYGGFMTQYLMTRTDIFAASMSHAGISNPTSYWGFGYWGYSYSAISAAKSYPWNNEKLLSGQAPLFNADKVHTPILFLHGASDTNVPINESIQMFTALKILGRECAFVTVEGQDHHITDYEKQIKWVNTYYAWFAKWLQDDPTWWNTLYPEKKL